MGCLVAVLGFFMSFWGLLTIVTLFNGVIAAKVLASVIEVVLIVLFIWCLKKYQCGDKKTDIFGKWWFWVIAIIVFLMMVSAVFGEDESENNISDAETTETENIVPTEETDVSSKSEIGNDVESTIPETEQISPISKTEILFRGIPWGTSSTEAKSIIESDGEAFIFILKDTTIDTVDHLLDIDYYSRLSNAGNILCGYNLSVAGYDVSQISLNFMYKVEDGKVDKSDDELYSAVYELDTTDHETVYLTLKQKLSDLYGEGNEVESSKKGWIFAQDYSGDYKYKILETTWYGANNTFVTLRWTSNNNEATSVQEECGIKIAYGKTDANEKLKILRDAIKEEQKEEDRDKSNSDNNEGL